jgi:tetratricopeptide (TPR) repeat protein
MDEAAVEYKLAIQLKPDFAQAHSDLGVLYAQMPGGLGNAILEFQTAIRAQPNYADAHLNLGRALSQMPGHSAEALSELEKAEELRPDPRVKAMIQQLRGSH